eukprot:gnl/Spiro4/18787_TR10039_c0_g1_i1.p1 gnl/Spiro4/18787_TR10039_c0_g1~~gnl/Spiro4/18787_TR10039_c0_g1_i1.p1  ORF type:complete len:210 (+),score=21.10 gnl/Spiro4/18787_TR10039_c0_g1_i1:44-673(+)
MLGRLLSSVARAGPALRATKMVPVLAAPAVGSTRECGFYHPGRKIKMGTGFPREVLQPYNPRVGQPGYHVRPDLVALERGNYPFDPETNEFYRLAMTVPMIEIEDPHEDAELDETSLQLLSLVSYIGLWISVLSYWRIAPSLWTTEEVRTFNIYKYPTLYRRTKTPFWTTHGGIHCSFLDFKCHSYYRALRIAEEDEAIANKLLNKESS